MPAVPAPSLLQKLEDHINIDVDCVDPDFVKHMPIRPHDQTSNQVLVDLELGKARNAELLVQAAKELGNAGWLAVYSRMAVLICQKNIGKIAGRVLLQTSPSMAYDTQATLEHGRLYDREFRRVGIGRDRYCIKIPSTGPALVAAKALHYEGIATLGTAVFGLPQAIACSQAGTLYISPYFNEIRAQENPKFWADCNDPAIQHPMSKRIIQILELYRMRYRETGKEQPLVKLASFISVQEVVAAAEMGCHSATVPHTLLDQLAQQQYDGSQVLGDGHPKPIHAYKCSNRMSERLRQQLSTGDATTNESWDWLGKQEVSYLDEGGSELTRAIDADPTAKTCLEEALKLFISVESRSKALIKAIMFQVANES